MATPQTQPRAEVMVRPLAENELAQADQTVRVAFGTFLGMPDPSAFMGDANYAFTRWKADPRAVLAAVLEGKLVGSCFATNWGSFGFFGPLTVAPEFWGRGIAQQLLGPTMEILRGWQVRHAGLYTFAHSPKHMALYQKFGFWPRDLVANVVKPVGDVRPQMPPDTSRFNDVEISERPALLAACREVTNANFEGLDVSREIRAVAEQKLGNSVLVWDGASLAAFAVCHTGPRSEAGTGVCYVKFAAVRPGPRATENLKRLLGAVEAFARCAWAHKIMAGVNVARRETYQALIAHGFRGDSQGVAMETGDASSGYNHAGVYILDDWR
jgi:GNAT superfamily N-acetyltransferase